MSKKFSVTIFMIGDEIVSLLGEKTNKGTKDKRVVWAYGRPKGVRFKGAGVFMGRDAFSEKTYRSMINIIEPGWLID